MDFGSKYVYKYAHSESESVSEDDDVIGNDPDALFIPHIRAGEGKGQHQQQLASDSVSSALASHKRKRLRKPDTNVVSVKFNQLLQPGEMHAGDPVYCTECGTVASHLSKIQTEREESSVEEASTNTEPKWHCEFCRNINTVDIEQTDLPKHEDATYLLSPAPAVHGSDMSGVDDSMVFFLIDVSGSMSSTTLVQGTFKLPNLLKQQERAAEAFGGAQMIRQHHQTYVSRLQGVQMAVDANLDKLVKDTPTKRAALLTFNHELTYYGDGTRTEPLVIRGDKLKSADDLLHEAERESNNELKPVGQTKTKLTERIYDLEEGGQTALGPAVVFALNIASKRQGSRIVICTDGLANRGLGSLETAQDERTEEAVRMQALHEGNQFYADLTERARDKGVSISVITIKGTACLLPVIGQMADGTGGGVTIVDLLNMRDEFATILEQQVIATNVEATLIVHRGLYIRNSDNPDEKLEKIKRDIGNVTKQTEVTFEFGVRNKEEVKEKYHIDLDKLQQLPFQIQVTYTAADGSKALRVLTQLKETTENREVAEVNAVRSVIAENHIRSTANDMMVAMSDDEDDETPRMRSKWSTPAVQKQRLAYMNNLSTKARSRGVHDTDQFNERRWNTASNELQSHVLASNSRKSAASRNAVLAAPPPSNSSGSIMSRVSRLISGSTKEEVSEQTAIVPSTRSKNDSKRNYGFATSNLSHYSDQHSENLYRYKNISSDYMRETSPTRDEGEPAVASDTNRFVARRNDNSDRPPVAATTRRAAARRTDDDDQPSAVANTGRFGNRRKDDDDQPATGLNTGRFGNRRRGEDDQPSAVANTDRFSNRRGDDDDQPATGLNTGRFGGRRRGDDDQPSAVANTDRFSNRRGDDDDQPATGLNTGRFGGRRRGDDDQPSAVANTDRFSNRRGDDDDQPATGLNTGRFGNRRRGEDDQPSAVANTDRFRNRRGDDDDQPATGLNTGRFGGRRRGDDDPSTAVSNSGRFGGRQNHEDQPATDSNTRRFGGRRKDDDDDDNDVIFRNRP